MIHLGVREERARGTSIADRSEAEVETRRRLGRVEVWCCCGAVSPRLKQ